MKSLDSKQAIKKSKVECKKMKKDAIWKPLIRLFRRYLKKDALPPSVYSTVRAKPLKEQGGLFCRYL